MKSRSERARDRMPWFGVGVGAYIAAIAWIVAMLGLGFGLGVGVDIVVVVVVGCAVVVMVIVVEEGCVVVEVIMEAM